MTQLSPFVYWAQSEQTLYIKVDLKDVKDPQITLETNKLQFQSAGVGAQGLNNYAFCLDFSSDIDSQKSHYNINGNRVDFTITKLQKSWWPRLLLQSQKPAWLKIDYDRFQSEDLADDEPQDVRDVYPNLYEQLQKEELGYKKEDFKMVYLSMYNLCMYVGFMYIVCVLSMRYLKDGVDSFAGTYAAVSPVMCFLQLMQFLEVLHPLFGYVSGGAFVPFIQIGGRAFILFILLEFEPRIQTMPVVFYLFMTWSTIEIIRYPYYMSQLFKKESGLLTWLRYSAWMICYPIGFTCESVIIFRNIIFIDQSGKWSIHLPEPVAYTIRFSALLRVYLLFVMAPAIYVLMRHMYKVRRQKIGPKIKKKVQ